jgi:single-strand DNA-binding protein
MNVNRWVGIGRLVRDPELRHTAGGTAVCNFTLAINNRKKEGDVWVDDPAFIDIDVWEGQAEACAQYLAKGKLAAVDGKIVQQRWEKDGEKRSKLAVRATNVQFLEPRGEASGAADEVPDSTDFAAPAAAAPDDDIQF